MDRAARDLYKFIEQVKTKLKVEGIDPEDYDACVACLERTVAPVACVRVYEEYIYNN